MALVAVVEAGVSDELAVRRNLRGLVGTVAMRELRQETVGDTDFKDFRVQRLVLVVGGAIHGNEERFSIRSPAGVGASKTAGTGAVRKFAGGELARRATIGGNHENL